jgi:hypothetical protein
MELGNTSDYCQKVFGSVFLRVKSSFRKGFCWGWVWSWVRIRVDLEWNGYVSELMLRDGFRVGYQIWYVSEWVRGWEGIFGDR